MKTIMEIFKLATRLNIKPKDVIGMGGDIVKMGQSLFNTKINPKLTEFVNKKGEIPENIMEQIKIHIKKGRYLRKEVNPVILYGSFETLIFLKPKLARKSFKELSVNLYI